jgi:hypothetical protein
MRKFYAAENTQKAVNTWDVLVFSSKSARDSYVESRDGYCHHFDNTIDCRAIPKRLVTEFASNWNCQRNEMNKPKPFTSECWMIFDSSYGESDIDGYIGEVVVGNPEYDSGERLF